jgi:hypothetical protein
MVKMKMIALSRLRHSVSAMLVVLVLAGGAAGIIGSGALALA